MAITDESGTAWVGLSPQHYGNLSVNLGEMLRFIREQKSISTYLRGCIDDANRHPEGPE